MLNKQQWISYDLAKKVPDMRRGFRIETNYGEIDIDEGDAKAFADLAERLLKKKLAALQEGVAYQKVFNTLFGAGRSRGAK